MMIHHRERRDRRIKKQTKIHNDFSLSRMKNWKIYITALVCIALLFSAGYAQYNNQGAFRSEDRAYDELLRDFKNGDWQKVLDKSDAFRFRYKRSEHKSSVTAMAASAALKSRRLDRAILETEKLELKFPHSRYIDDARWIRAQCAIMSERWEEAEERLNWIIGFTDDDSLRTDARRKLEELRRFLEHERELEKSRKLEPESFSPWVALLLPMNGAYEEKAEDFALGFQTRWADVEGGKIMMFNTGSDPVQAVQIARRLAFEDSVWAFVGGLELSEATALAATSELEQIPFLTTVCGVSGLADIGRYVFQGRPNYNIIGQELAKYAIHELGCGKFGVLIPQNQEGLQIASGFKSKIETAGLEIIAQEVYYPGTEDFKDYFARIRKIGLRLQYDDSLRTYYSNFGCILRDSVKYKPPREALTAVPPGAGIAESSEIDSLINLSKEDTTWTLSDEFLDSLWLADHERLREWMIETSNVIDSLEIPLNIIDGFLFLIEPERLEIAAPQFARAHIQATLLGNEHWADRDALSKVTDYVDGIVYNSPLAAVGGEVYYEFIEKIAGDSAVAVNHFHLAGERAAQMIKFAAEKSMGPEDMRKALSQIRDLETLSGKVSLLKEERIDRRVRLVRYLNGKFEVVEE